MARSKKKVVEVEVTQPIIPPELSLREVNLDKKHVVLNIDGVEVERLVVLCSGGFGCSPTSLGSAVFGKRIGTGDSGRWDRYNFLRLATDAEVAAATKFYKKHALPSVIKRAERGFKLLLEKQTGQLVLRLLRAKDALTYRLIVYRREDERWTATPDDNTDVDALLVAMNGY